MGLRPGQDRLFVGFGGKKRRQTVYANGLASSFVCKKRD